MGTFSLPPIGTTHHRSGAPTSDALNRGTLPPGTVDIDEVTGDVEWTTDGLPPTASPAVIVAAGIRTLFVSWVAETNHDPIIYEIHISDVSGFTPDATTLAGVTTGTMAALYTEADGVTPLDYATTYYVRLVATDEDGAAAPGVQGSGMPLVITAPDLADLSVTAAKIAANAVTTTKIAADAVTAGQIAANAVGSSELDALAVTAAKIAANAVTTSKIAADAVTANEIAAGTITAAEILAGTITGAEIHAGAILAAHIVANTITAAEIATGAITSDEIAANTITAGDIAAGTITTAQIMAETILADNIAANAITSDKIMANAITADKILANEITGEHLSAVIVLAGLIQTATVGQRVEISTTGIRLIDPSGTTLVDLPTEDGLPAIFRGNIETTSILVQGGLILSGTSNVMDKGSTLLLNEKQQDPGSPATLSLTYEVGPSLTFPGGTSANYGLYYHSATNVYYTVVKSAGDFTVVEYDGTTGATLRSEFLFSGEANFFMGCAVCGTNLLIVFRRASNGDIRCVQVDLPTFVPGSAFNLSVTGGQFMKSGGSVDGNRTSAVGGNGTVMYLCYWDSSSDGSNKRVDVYNSSGAKTGTFTLTGGLTNLDTRGIRGFTAQDSGAFTVGVYNSNHLITTFERFDTSTHAVKTANGDVWAKPSSVAGLTYRNSKYHMNVQNTDETIYFSNFVWTPGTDKFWIGYEWYDGSHVTKVSPLASILLNGSDAAYPAGQSGEVMMRGRIRITVPILAGGVLTRTYAKNVVATPTATALFLQAPTTYITSDSLPGREMLLYNSGGAAPADSNNFVGGTSTIAAIAATGLPWVLGGNGLLRLPRFATAARLASPVAGDTHFDTTLLDPMIYDGTTWRSPVKVVPVNVNVASTTTHTGGSMQVTIAGLRVGDYCIWLSSDITGAGTQFNYFTDPVCSTAGQITLRWFNADTGTIDPAAANHYFLIVRQG